MDVLVVDDDKDARKSLSGFIRSEGHTCRAAKNGREALKRIGNYRPNLIIAEISMSEMTGIELARYIREKYSKENVKIILICGHCSAVRKVRRIANIRIDDMIKKPIDVSKLRKYFNPNPRPLV